MSKVIATAEQELIKSTLLTEHDFDTCDLASLIRLMNERHADAITQAVAAERERCAKVAEDAEDGHTNTYRNSEDDYNASCGYNEACSNIAAAIRSGK